MCEWVVIIAIAVACLYIAPQVSKADGFQLPVSTQYAISLAPKEQDALILYRS